MADDNEKCNETNVANSVDDDSQNSNVSATGGNNSVPPVDGSVERNLTPAHQEERHMQSNKRRENG